MRIVVLGCVLRWLTFQSNSLRPAVLIHWLSNVGMFVMDDSMRVWWRTLSWFVVA